MFPTEKTRFSYEHLLLNLRFVYSGCKRTRLATLATSLSDGSQNYLLWSKAKAKANATATSPSDEFFANYIKERKRSKKENALSTNESLTGRI